MRERLPEPEGRRMSPTPRLRGAEGARVREVSPDSGAVARRVIAYEVRGSRDSRELAEAGERTWERLRRRLVVLIGPTGFDAVSARAVRLSSADLPWLAGVRSEASDGRGFIGLREATDGHAPDEVLEAMETLLDNFLAVLTRLIQFDLVLRLLGEEWAELRLEDVRPTPETKG